jgi:hypothetical protein
VKKAGLYARPGEGKGLGMAYRLTEKRLLKATPILDEAFEYIVKNRAKRLPDGFEGELTRCWDITYQELKYFMKDMLELERYKYLAVLYMETSNCTHIVSEFKKPLEHVHGLESYSHDTFPEERKPFWEEFCRCYPAE